MDFEIASVTSKEYNPNNVVLREKQAADYFGASTVGGKLSPDKSLFNSRRSVSVKREAPAEMDMLAQMLGKRN